MANIVPFESAKLPAFLAQGFELTNDLIVSGGGFPTLSIKGKVFHLKRGDEKELICKPESPDEPAASLEVVILKAGPAGNKLAHVYYDEGYAEGADSKPTCYSNDGIAPSPNSQKPQCATCQACPQAVWGSKISDNGKKIKACSDSKRLAIAPAGQINDPMLLRVPADSLKALTQFGDTLAKRGVPYQAVVCRIGFDYSVAHPALTFKPMGFVDEATLKEIQAMQNSDLVNSITGIVEEYRAPEEQFAQAPTEAPKPVTKPAATPKPAAKPAAKPAPVAEDNDPQPKVSVKVEAKPEPKKAEPVDVIDDDMETALNDLDFDD